MILVFGKTGQVAMELQLLDDVIALGRNEADLSNPVACANIIRNFSPKAVINAAAYTAVDKAEEEEELATLINGEAPKFMALACKALNIPFVHISTDYVFEGNGNTPWKNTSATAPQNAYGRSKLLGEEGICVSGATYAILRTSWVFSSHGTNFVKTMLRLSNTHDSLSIVGDQIGGPTPASDIATACLKITKHLQTDSSKSGIYHFTGAPDVSWVNFASEIFLLTGRSVKVTHIQSSDYPTPAKRPLNSRLDCTTTKNIFNVSRPNWRIGLKQILKKLEVKL